MRETGGLAFVVVLMLGFGTACERPFIEQRPPDIEVVSPDLSIIRIERTLTLEVRATSLNSVDSVLLNGLPMNAEENNVFALDVNLGRGVNDLRVEAFGSEGTRRADTLEAIFLPAVSDLAELRLPGPLGGHTATRLGDGDLLIAGGARLPTGNALNEALRYEANNLAASPRSIPLRNPRMEHTATRLPDGRILFVGGSTVFRPNVVEQLVEEVEIYQPGFDSTMIIPVRGDPVRRSGHTAVLFPVRQNGSIQIYLYLYGGYGDIRYSPSPRMGIRSDIRVFQFRNDSLLASGPTFGPSIDPIADHSVTEIHPPVGSDAQYLFCGSYFTSDDVSDSIAFESLFSTTSGILVEDFEPMNQPRTGHAAARLVDGEVIVFGGRTFSLTGSLSSVEAYYSRPRRFFDFPPEIQMLQERWGHTATNWDDSRILIVGGFGFTGAGLQTSEWFRVEPRSSKLPLE